ncbi:hypothetical protein [Rhizobium sp. BR 362]|uniref:hypothetical protein n=1 Tax=Rhizobium sp. BR 362 TaxID=3040670 RepID=UPI002F3F9B45
MDGRDCRCSLPNKGDAHNASSELFPLYHFDNKLHFAFHDTPALSDRLYLFFSHLGHEQIIGDGHNRGMRQIAVITRKYRILIGHAVAAEEPTKRMKGKAAIISAAYLMKLSNLYMFSSNGSRRRSWFQM